MLYDVTKKYPKQLQRKLLDMIMINKRLNDALVRHLLIKYGFIKQSTKIIISVYHLITDYHEGTTYKKQYYLINVRNGRKQDVFTLRIYLDDIPEILQD